MSFVRPEVRAVLIRWREALIGGAIGLAALPFLGSVFLLHRVLAWVALLIGVVLIWQGIRRARFPASGGGEGVVEVNERQITYFGPLGGGAVSIDDLTHVQIRATAYNLFWDFTDATGETLTIPGDAEGTDALFDALAPLSGVSYEAITEASVRTDESTHIVWTRAPTPGR